MSRGNKMLLKKLILGTNIRILQRLRPFYPNVERWMSSEQSPPNSLTEGEIKISDVLKEKFPKHTELNVQDVSGGCGAFYLIEMEAEEFTGVRTLKRHQMVKEALKDEIKDLHGLKLELKAPS